MAPIISLEGVEALRGEKCHECHFRIRSLSNILKKMAKRFTLLFILFALVGGVVSGTPLRSSDESMMKCCDKAKSKERSPSAEASRLCCGLNCSNSAPTPSGSSFNSAPSNFTITGSVVEHIAALFAKEKTAAVTAKPFSREILSRTFQPRYIQNNSFLI